MWTVEINIAMASFLASQDCEIASLRRRKLRNDKTPLFMMDKQGLISCPLCFLINNFLELNNIFLGIS
jgi:hypothetical protein